MSRPRKEKSHFKDDTKHERLKIHSRVELAREQRNAGHGKHASAERPRGLEDWVDCEEKLGAQR